MDDFSNNGGLWLFAILALMWGGGFGGFGNAGFANAIGYQNLAAQNRYDALKNTNDINAVTIGQTQKILDAMAQNKIEALQNRIAQLELQQATGNTVKYPTTMSYTAGVSPFCNCGFNGLYA